jgi:hypothetical protein
MKKATRILDRKGEVAAFDRHYTGDEPEWIGAESFTYQEWFKRMSRGLGFYGYYCDSASLRTFLVEWMKKNGYSKSSVSTLSSAPVWAVSATAGKLARMLQRGMPDSHPDALKEWKLRRKAKPDIESAPPKSASATIRELVAEAFRSIEAEEKKTPLAAQAEKEESVVTAPAPNPVLRLEEKVNREIIYELDGLIDDLVSVKPNLPPGRIPRLDVGSLLRSRGIPAKGAPQVVAWIEKQLEEVKGAYDKTCPQLVEAYSCYSRPHQKKMIENWEAMMLEAQNHGKIKVRAPRVKKPKSAEKLVAKLQFKTEDPDYSIKSVDPMNLPYAQRAYIFNTNTRQLCIYLAAGRDGFSIKGTTLTGFDPEKSIMIRLRKPEDMLSSVLSGTTKKIDKAIASLKAKSAPANGRVNKHMIILKTFKEL